MHTNHILETPDCFPDARVPVLLRMHPAMMHLKNSYDLTIILPKLALEINGGLKNGGTILRRPLKWGFFRKIPKLGPR